MPGNRWLLCLSVGICGVAAACGESSDSRAKPFVRDSAGTRIVENRRAAWPAGAGWRLSEAPLLRIGAVSSSEPAYEFSYVIGGARLADGRIVALEGQTSEIRWFRADGTFQVGNGGRGGGPGEFTFASGMLRLPGDTIVVEDVPGVQHQLFSPSGEFVRKETIEMSRLMALGPWSECLNATLPDRSLLRCRPEPGEPAIVPNPGPGHLRTYSRFVRVPWAADTVIPLGLEGGIEQWGVDYGGRTQFAMHPFFSYTVVAAGGQDLEIAIAINPAYSIEIWDPNGHLIRIVRRLGARHVATAEERAESRTQMVRSVRDQALANRLVAEVEVPDSVPAVAGLEIDGGNHLWVLRNNRLESSPDLSADVFDGEGVFLGSVDLPARLQVLEIGEDYLLGVRRDENDVPFIELYRILKSG